MNHRNQIKSKRTIALLLAAVCAIGVILTGCKKQNGDGQYDKLRDRIQAAKEKETGTERPAENPADEEPSGEPAGDAFYDKLASIVNDADPKQWDSFALVDLDGDGIMELFAANFDGERDDPGICPYMIVAQDVTGEPVINDDLLFDGVAGAGGYRGSLYLLEGMGRLREVAFYAPLGTPADTIYVMEDGTIEILDYGYFETDSWGDLGDTSADDWDLFEHGEWKWNDKVVTEEEYDSNLEADLRGARETAFSDLNWLSKEKVLQELKKFSASAGNVSEEPHEEQGDDLKPILMRKSGATEDQVIVFEQQDYDGDGKEEAFALIGEVVDDPEVMRTVVGNIWFISSDESEKLLHEGIGMGFQEGIRTMTLGKTTYALFDEVYATANLTYVWYVQDGKAVEAPFSAAGEVITDVPEGEDRFRIMDSSYDCSYYPDTDSWMGHTWKHYYFFYFDEIDEVCEYAGAYITQQTVPFLCGRDLVKELVPKGAKMDSLYCRGNGHIVINYELAGDGCVNYYHYIYDFLKGSFVDDTGEETQEEPLDGICKEALCPDIANYPEVPNPEN